jgi:large subunit ribosomal protein L6
MSRIGKKSVAAPAGVTVAVDGQTVKVKGPKGELSFTAPAQIKVERTAVGSVSVSPAEDTKQARAMWGMARTQVVNLVEGVTKGYAQTLEIHGVGFRAAMKGKDIQLQVGYSHDVIHQVPAGLDVKVGGAKQELVTVSGIDKQKVGQFAAELRAARPPEPYQGKGVRYQGEYIFRKEGKKK